MSLKFRRLTASLASLALAVSGVAVATSAAASGTSPRATVTITPGVAGPMVALPGTLVFIKDDNVWYSRSDGTGLVQVTSNGYSSNRYSSPVMDANGVIAVLLGNDVIRMTREGTVLSTVDGGTLLPISEGGLQGTSSVALSPDGTKIAYDQTSWKGFGYSINVGTRFSASSYLSSVAEQELYRSSPKWVTDSRVVMRDYTEIYLRDLASSTSVKWFEDDDVFGDPDCDFLCFGEELYDPEVSRDGSRLVTMRAPTDSPWLVTYTVSGNVKTSVPSVPTVMCTFGTSELDSEFSTPTIGPNNRSIAWQMADGIYVKASMDNCELDDLALVVPGGSDPSWSGATYQAPAPGPKPNPKPKPGDKIALTKAPVVTGKAKVGTKLKATQGSWSPAPAKVTYQWKRGGKAIKKATKATYKLTKADAGKKITVTVTATRSGYAKASATSKAVTVGAVSITKPKIKKKPAAKVGKTLKVTKGKWKGKVATYAYQWFRGTKKIKGATKAKYTLTRADRGKRLRVKVIAKRPGAPKVAVWTAKTKKVR